MKYTTTLTVLALAASANAASPLVPGGISSGCSDVLNQLNSDSTFQGLVQPLITATEQFSATSNKSASSTDVKSALNTLCKSSFDEAAVRSWVTKVGDACSGDLTNKDVLSLYDSLYVFTPLRGAICAVDSGSQNYCVTLVKGNVPTPDVIAPTTKAAPASSSASAGSSSASGSASQSASASHSASASASASESASATSSDKAATTSASGSKDLSSRFYVASNYLINRGEDVVRSVLGRALGDSGHNRAAVITPNATTYQNTNLPFLFLQPSDGSKVLCTSCTREIFVPYVKWGTQTPYRASGGVDASPILGGQNKLWKALGTTCGSNFTSAILAEAGATTFASASAGSLQAVPAAATVLVGVVAAFLAL